MKPIIRVRNLSKLYRLGELQRPMRIVDWFGETFSRRNGHARNGAGRSEEEQPQEIWALKDVSFDVAPGEVVGIIGRNGAGKSTLLKILSRITEPTEGEVELFGRVSSLLEVGTGFHPELTGRDNVYLNGSILGLKKAEIDRKFDEIVSFAGVEKFLDTPVKRYSSGMQMRLAFAVAAHLEPEILIVDEVLAVGDAEFQRKCIGKMGEVASSGRTIIFVSHNMAAVENLCNRALVVRAGELDMQGTVSDCVAFYMSEVRSLRDKPLSSKLVKTADFASLGGGPSIETVRMGDGVELRLAFMTPSPTIRPRVGVVFRRSGTGEPVFGVDSDMLGVGSVDQPDTAFNTSFKFDELPLVHGSYYVDLYVGCDGQNHEVVRNILEIQVQPSDIYGTGRIPYAHTGPLYIMPKLTIISQDEAAKSLTHHVPAN